MRTVKISEITISHAARTTDVDFSFREKIELAKLLDRTGADIIEFGSLENKKADSLLVKSLVGAVKNSRIAVSIDPFDEASAEEAYEALKEAKNFRLQVQLPVSTVQMEYICHMKGKAVLELIKSTVKKCAEFTDDVEFTAVDASRSEEDFLLEAFKTAAEAGAGTVTYCDDAGIMLPEELYGKIKSLKEAMPESTALGVLCSNELFMADALASSVIKAGADEIKCSAYFKVATSLSGLAKILSARPDWVGAKASLRTAELGRTIKQIEASINYQADGARPQEAGRAETEENICLTAKDDKTSVEKAAAALGYELSDEDLSRVYDSFMRIAEKKESVSEKELDAIIASAAMQVPSAYKIESYIINSGNSITACAHMRLIKNGQVLESVCLGDGPINAAFLAIEQVVGRHFELDDFQVRSVTEGHESMGETVVRLRSNGRLYSGRGISTDVIGSSIRAYINAVNKIVFEEEDR